MTTQSLLQNSCYQIGNRGRYLVCFLYSRIFTFSLFCFDSPVRNPGLHRNKQGEALQLLMNALNELLLKFFSSGN